MIDKSPEGDFDTSRPTAWMELKSIREAHGLTLNDVFQSTRITIGSLEAIEAGEFAKLPPPIYARAYIKAYAKMLGVDEKPLISDYERYISSCLCDPQDDPLETDEPRTYISKRAIHISFIVVVTCLIGLLLYKQSYFRVADIYLDCPFLQKTQKPSNEIKAAAIPAVTAAPYAEKEAKDQGMPVEQTGNMAAAVQAPTDPASEKAREDVKPATASTSSVQESSAPLLITATEDTWLRIREDNKKPYQMVLKPGEKIERRVSAFFIDVGNAGGITIEFHGKTMKNLGKSGEVVHLRLPEN